MTTLAAPSGQAAADGQSDRIAAGYARGAATASGARTRSQAAARFAGTFGTVQRWADAPLAARLAGTTADRAFAAHAAIATGTCVDASFVVASHCQWGRHLTAADPSAAAQFTADAASLGFSESQIRHMWSRLAQICAVTGHRSDTLTPADYRHGRAALLEAATTYHRAGNAVTTPLYCLDAVMFQRGQGNPPAGRRSSNPGHETGWDTVAASAPQMAATMTRYLDQIQVSLRPGSVGLIDTTLRQLAGMTDRLLPRRRLRGRHRPRTHRGLPHLAGHTAGLPRRTAAVHNHRRDAHGSPTRLLHPHQRVGLP